MRRYVLSYLIKELYQKPVIVKSKVWWKRILGHFELSTSSEYRVKREFRFITFFNKAHIDIFLNPEFHSIIKQILPEGAYNIHLEGIPIELSTFPIHYAPKPQNNLFTVEHLKYPNLNKL